MRQVYGAPRWIPAGPITRTTIRVLLRAMNVAYPLFRPIREARRRLDALEASSR